MIYRYHRTGATMVPSSSFDKYFPARHPQSMNDIITENNHNTLEDFIILVTGAFENKCMKMCDNLGKLTGTRTHGDIISRIDMTSKFEKRRRAIYSSLNELENLRKTMVRAQQIHQSHVNEMRKENYTIRRILSKKETDQIDQKYIVERNTRIIEHAKHCSREITRTIILKNIHPLKLKLKESLDDFLLFAELIIDMKHRCEMDAE
jgi:hypothetical protein